jgi:hypothetical protein
VPTEENSFDLESVNITVYVQLCNCAYLALKWKEKQVTSEKTALNKEPKTVLVPNKENSFDLEIVSIAVYVQILTVLFGF